MVSSSILCRVTELARSCLLCVLSVEQGDSVFKGVLLLVICYFVRFTVYFLVVVRYLSPRCFFSFYSSTLGPEQGYLGVYFEGGLVTKF